MPRSDSFLYDVCIDIYRAMYKKTNPKLDFNTAITTGITRIDNWFMKYYLHENIQLSILDYHCKKHHLTPYEKLRIEREVLRGSAPNSDLKAWKELTKEEK